MSVDSDMLLVDKYYVKASNQDQEKCLRGQIYWSPCLHFRPDVQLLRVESEDPLLQRPTKLALCPMSEGAFTDTHKPSLHPPLRWDEELMVLRAKKRPVIIFSNESELWSPVTGANPLPRCFLVAPMYTFHPNHSERFKARVVTFNYPDLFYMPADSELGMQEGFVNFGQMQVVPKTWLEPTRVCLTADACELLTSWFGYYVCQDQSESLGSLISLMLEHHQEKEPFLTDESS